MLLSPKCSFTKKSKISFVLICQSIRCGAVLKIWDAIPIQPIHWKAYVLNQQKRCGANIINSIKVFRRCEWFEGKKYKSTWSFCFNFSVYRFCKYNVVRTSTHHCLQLLTYQQLTPFRSLFPTIFHFPFFLHHKCRFLCFVHHLIFYYSLPYFNIPIFLFVHQI